MKSSVSAAPDEAAALGSEAAASEPASVGSRSGASAEPPSYTSSQSTIGSVCTACMATETTKPAGAVSTTRHACELL